MYMYVMSVVVVVRMSKSANLLVKQGRKEIQRKKERKECHQKMRR
jgi:hypothetical protein